MKSAAVAVLAAVLAFAAPEAAVPAGKPEDLYPFRRRTEDSIVLTWEDARKRCFHGLNIGALKKDAAAVLAPDFEQSYLSEQDGGIGIYTEKPDGAYYLCAVFDEANRVILITYQKNQISGLENPQ